MDTAQKIGTFAINANQALLTDLQDMNDCMEKIVISLANAEGKATTETWNALRILQAKIAKGKKQCLTFPGYVHKLVPDTHQTKRNLDASTG